MIRPFASEKDVSMTGLVEWVSQDRLRFGREKALRVIERRKEKVCAKKENDKRNSERMRLCLFDINDRNMTREVDV